MVNLKNAAGLALALLMSSAGAQNVTISNAWARATVPGQQSTGAFMTFTAKEGTKLVGISTPAAGVAEIHEMKVDKDVMKMSAVPVLDLPAGQVVELKPGGYHLMLMDLKAPLSKDSTLALTLRWQDAKGGVTTQLLQVPVRQQPPMAQGQGHDHGGGTHAHGAQEH